MDVFDLPDKIPASEEYYDVGPHHTKISTSSKDAQTWFDRGVTWIYSFNHGEAIKCFKQTIVHDPRCAMGYWGAAYAAGPNYNKISWNFFAPDELRKTLSLTHSLVQKAAQVAAEEEATSPYEAALINALQSRYPDAVVPTKVSELDLRVLAYADAMRKVYNENHENNLDIITWCAEALMNTAPWRLYHSGSGEPNLETPVLEVKAMLEKALKIPDSRRHPGLLHLYIHLTEMSRTPEVAVLAADCLRDLVPDGAHISHMPSHIDVLVGDYRRAMNTNITAIRADHKYLSKNPKDYFYHIYMMHNYHSGIYAATLAGNQRISLELTEAMDSTLTEDLLSQKQPDMANFAEAFKSVKMHVLIRFGMWEEIKKLKIPNDRELFCVTTATVLYAKAIAYSATGDIPRAEEQGKLFLEAASKVPPTRLDFPVVVRDELEVAKAMLVGELEYRKGNYDEAFSHLRKAVELDDALTYSEPWGWLLPTRHPLAALLLEQNRVEEALQVYAEDLGFDDKLVRAHQHPNNIWALTGYHECLVKLGRKTEAAVIKKQLTIAEAGSDVEIRFSCFCRLGGPDNCCA